MEHYGIKDNGFGQFEVYHKSSGCTVSPVGALGACDRVEAAQWCKRCEDAAPYDAVEAAAAAMIADNIPQDWRKRAYDRIGLTLPENR